MAFILIITYRNHGLVIIFWKFCKGYAAIIKTVKQLENGAPTEHFMYTTQISSPARPVKEHSLVEMRRTKIETGKVYKGVANLQKSTRFDI